ncbi:MAG: aldehyde ferredoxin oxidoreductase family protein, partial [Deltaproteobacteria bacterium]|nr:aldehyde ferredoxin oxidoreductase family protein [Deltaproteobacteria bacterium]
MPLSRKIAYIDLSRKEVRVESIPEKIRRLYLGGRGIDMYLLYNHMAPGADALGPDNVLLISGGLLVGTVAPGASRTHVGGKSPLTGTIGSSNMGGYFAPELAFAGFHHLVITGKAKGPVYLWIHNGDIEIREASHIWGHDTIETQEMIRKELGDNRDEIQVACIGRGGENLVRYACVLTGLKNAAGRTGMGAVMGSKNLKAVAVRGTMDIDLAQPQKALEYAFECKEKLMSTKFAEALGYDGTMFIWNVTNTTGMVRYRNVTSNRIEDWENLSVEEFHEKFKVGWAGCFNCPVHCRHQWQIKSGRWAGMFGEGPEYNTQLTLGGPVDITEWEPVLVSQQLCDRHGLDLSEVGNLIAWVMDLYNKGLIDKKVTGGLDLSWDNSNEIAPALIEQIAGREGLGALLADGCEQGIANFEKQGVPRKKSTPLLPHIKNASALGVWDAGVSLAFGLSVSTRGWDHLRSRPAIDHYGLPAEVYETLYESGPQESSFTSYFNKASHVWWFERHYAVVDSIGTCKFHSCFFTPHGYSWDVWSKWVETITGLNISPEDLRAIGERIYTIERMFNNREGFTRKDDYLPDYYYRPKPSGLPVVRGHK